VFNILEAAFFVGVWLWLLEDCGRLLEEVGWLLEQVTGLLEEVERRSFIS